MRTKIFAVIAAIFMLFSVGCGKEDNSGIIKSFTVKDTLQSVDGQVARVVLLYGQSNATGVANNAYLGQKDADAYAIANAGYDSVKINYFTENGGNSSGGEFVNCKLGQAASADYFGPEVGIADVLSETYQSETTFIIKYSWGGSALDFQWLDGNHNRGDMYFAAKAFTLTSLKYLEKKGYKPIIQAVCWMQGETDSTTEDMTNKYYKNTEKFVSYLKNDFKGYYEDDFKFIDAGIAEIIFWTNHVGINAAKKSYADSHENCYYFSTQEMGLTTLEEPAENPDVAHYDSTSMLALGKKFGEIAVG